MGTFKYYYYYYYYYDALFYTMTTQISLSTQSFSKEAKDPLHPHWFLQMRFREYTNQLYQLLVWKLLSI